MSKYTSAENLGKTALYVYKFNPKLKFVYIDRAFQPEIMVKSQREAAISNRWNFRGEWIYIVLTGMVETSCIIIHDQIEASRACTQFQSFDAKCVHFA